MYADKLETAEEIIQRIFDPRYNYRYIPLSVKYAYLKHYLEAKWTDICGPNLAKRCSIQKIEGQELHVRTANSLLANELYMMQDLFLQKVNSFLLGRVLIKKVYFHTGSLQRQQAKKQQEPASPPAVAYSTCPVCGAKMLADLPICSVCEREQREKQRQQLAELLRIQPWLNYENCRSYCSCDKILFTAVKDGLKNFYFERVRQGYATKKECLMAVMFLTEKQPEEITEGLYENALAYLRRDQSVSAFGSRLYGKKQ